MGVAFSVQSQSTDSIRFSLLTCAPGTEIYSLFGHTAIRYEKLYAAYRCCIQLWNV